MMKFNPWTLALAAAGVVTLPSLLHADEQKPTFLQTALTSTTISGYVDTSAQWNLGSGNAGAPAYTFGGPSKADGFNLNVVDLALDRPPDATPWGAGYHVELWFGPDADALGTQSTGTTADFAIRQAYVALTTPVGNGITWKIGTWDTIIGYEGLSSPGNPNYTHSYGFTIEPTTHTGIQGSYQVNDEVSLTAGVANTFGAAIDGRTTGGRSETDKTYLGSVSFTCPTNWGWLSGSSVSGGVINGFNSGPVAHDQTSWYVGATMNTPLSALKLGASYDYAGVSHQPLIGNHSAYANAVALYANYQATEKLALNVRGEYASTSITSNTNGITPVLGGPGQVFAATLTAQYDLWKNVLSRVEVRWDHACDDSGPYGGTTVPGGSDNSVILAANIIYKF